MEKVKNKTVFLQLKENLELMKESQDILEQKREFILKEILSVLDEVDFLRDRLNQQVLRAYNLLIKTYMEIGEERVEKESRLVVFKGELQVFQKVFFGIVVPEVKYKIEEEKMPIDVTSESIFLELSRKAFLNALKLILELTNIEIKAWKLAEELKKTTVRINALKNYYIPKYELTIKEIKESLDQIEREGFLNLKIIKKHLKDKDVYSEF